MEKVKANILVFLTGMILGIVIGGVTVLNGVDNTENLAKQKVKNLLHVIKEDNEDYFDELSNTDEYYSVIDWIIR